MREETRKRIEEVLSGFPICEYAFLRPEELPFSEKVRYICRTECPRYGKSWACPPAVGTVEACRKNFDKHMIQLYRDVLNEGNEKGKKKKKNVDLVADILHYSIKGIETPYIRGLIGTGIPEDESRRCVMKLVFGALGKTCQ